MDHRLGQRAEQGKNSPVGNNEKGNGIVPLSSEIPFELL